ncbi:hypothetical protein GCM10007877_10270 [Marinibactrum halimedae]|uniref:Uncharacterized protein n=1 Tax=Marinibactrum halimedae TaxID=1444977 RepID=A0AA37T2L7_9GAMM|nr:hypothetical protein GCM10007877_10270 [Marinibactrum halimedae]
MTSEIKRSGITRKAVARALSEKRGREISEAKLNKMLNRLTNDQGFVFEIFEVLNLQLIAVPIPQQ